MKQIIKLSTIYLLLIATCHASWSPYIGLGVGLSKSQNPFTGSLSNNNGSGTTKLNMDTTGTAESFILGLRNQQTNFFLVGEWFSTIHQFNIKRKGNDIYTPVVGAPPGFMQVFGTVDFEVTQKYTHGISGHIGKDLMKDVDVFFKVDLFWSKFTIKYSNTTSTYKRGQESKWLFGFGPGVGLQYHITKSISTRLDYSYRIYNEFKSKNIGYDSADKVTGKIAPRIHQFALALLYKF